MYSGIRRRLTLSRRYCPLVLDFNAYQEPTPDSKKKSGIVHKASRIMNKDTMMLCSAFFKCHPKRSKNLALWKKKTASMALILSQSMS